ncbi:hypothetical protein [Methylobacterium thuringiense]|uniref:DUF4164 family protein n=1 Tax=Methylobacterium thuringiense TaxID=1003091 RepID=A0ABQ4TRW9_9HYPH|nr:hypothetical protein [Methylobacterium thuringiense]GJE57139.1 hypothetical protein EKPJFOCH_3651 [Methylobacterium thuringiense]
MKARMQELLGLLTMVVERVGAANARTAQAESRAERMSLMLDALSDENAALQTELDEAEETAQASAETIRSLREQVEAGERLAEMLEARATEAELRIHRAADALGLSAAADPSVPGAEAPRPSVALH